MTIKSFLSPTLKLYMQNTNDFANENFNLFMPVNCIM